MIHRRTIIILVIFLLIAGFFYGYDILYKKEQEEKKEKAKLFFPVEKDEITEIKLKKNVVNIVFEKQKDNSWLIIEPDRYKANDREINGMLDQLVGLKQREIIDEEPEDLSVFGLEDKFWEVELKTPIDHYAVLFGDKNPTGNGFYVKKPGESRVMLAPTYISYYLEKNLDDFRETSPLNIDTGKVTKLVIRYPGKDIEIRKVADRWEIEKPFKEKADRQEVSDYIWTLYNPSIKKFLPSGPPGDDYLLEISVWQEEKGEPRTLKVLKLADDEENYITWRKFLDEKFYLPRKEGDKLFSSAKDFIDRHICSFNDN
ncbi:MAG: DUF4340 domain-containing protein, partial [Candidatus Eremiobacteraeota bacterium]|nr:DUF4340 domain-containing protein [Candidatus Eremiobacteraeota bacterium]